MLDAPKYISQQDFTVQSARSDATMEHQNKVCPEHFILALLQLWGQRLLHIHTHNVHLVFRAVSKKNSPPPHTGKTGEYIVWSRLEQSNVVKSTP